MAADSAPPAAAAPASTAARAGRWRRGPSPELAAVTSGTAEEATLGGDAAPQASESVEHIPVTVGVASDQGSEPHAGVGAPAREKQPNSSWRSRTAVQGVASAVESKLVASKVGEPPVHIGPDAAITLRSGLLLPLLGLGTRQLKTGTECRDAVRAALRCGYRLIDTSPLYANEEDVRHGIRAAGLRREDVFLVAKLPPGDHGDHEDVREALDGTLQRLGTSYVDLYLIQSPKGGSLLETWDAMLEMKASGMARAVGVSNFGAGHLQNLAAAGREMPEVVQVELHFGLQQRALTSYCAKAGIAIMASSPLARGRLFGGGTPLAGLAARRGRTEAELAIRWCLQSGFAAIPKSKDAKRIESNAAFGFSLSAAEMAEIRLLERGFVVSSTTRCAELPWEDLLQDISEVSEEDAEGGRAPQRRRRRRRRKGKGKGKGANGAAGYTAGAAGSAGRGRGGGKGGGSTATRWSDTLSSLS